MCRNSIDRVINIQNGDRRIPRHQALEYRCKERECFTVDQEDVATPKSKKESRTNSGQEDAQGVQSVDERSILAVEGCG
jgi:hypothetical protein